VEEIGLDGFLADSVSAVQGKLYALGAGWNRITVPMFPARHDRIAIGLLFRIPAGAPRRARRFELRVLGTSGEQVVLGSGAQGPIERVGGEFTAGGDEEQLVPIALNLNGLPLPRPGEYRVTISIDGEDVRELPFRVQARTAAQPVQSPETGTAGYL
jgi:hypothetical protein